MARDAPEQRLQAIDESLAAGSAPRQACGLFGADGRRIAGNLESLPVGLGPIRGVQNVVVVRVDAQGPRGANSPCGRPSAAEWRNPDDRPKRRRARRNSDRSWRSALALGLLPALCLASRRGVLLEPSGQETGRGSQQEGPTHRRAAIARSACRHRVVDDPFDKLAVIVNGMLDEIEALIHEHRRSRRRHCPRSADAIDPRAGTPRTRP